MSWLTDATPDGPDGVVDLVVEPVTKDLGGFRVRRALPSPRRKLIGPFIFLDHLGPARFEAGQGIDVRPHPHIGLATLTYLVEGRIRHRDSVGSDQEIVPGDVNWMTAGARHRPFRTLGLRPHRRAGVMAGLQELGGPAARARGVGAGFSTTSAPICRFLRDGGVTVRLIAGSAYGATSPVATLSAMVYADVTMAPGHRCPCRGSMPSVACMCWRGAVSIGGESYGGVSPAGVPTGRRGHAAGRGADAG